MTKAVAIANLSSSSTSNCPTASASQDQTSVHSPGANLPESDISAELFQTLLGKFKFEAAIGADGELRIGSAFGPVICVRFEPKGHWIILHTGFETPALDDQERTDLASYLSNNLAMVSLLQPTSGLAWGIICTTAVA